MAALDSQAAWRPRPRQLDQLFCVKFHRVVALDCCQWAKADPLAPTET
ncbi:MAG: hypothetical protein ACRENV_03900 [Candidatus Dormibacteria bacterium]